MLLTEWSEKSHWSYLEIIRTILLPPMMVILCVWGSDSRTVLKVLIRLKMEDNVQFENLYLKSLINEYNKKKKCNQESIFNYI